jgi:hypothetical protein
MKKEVQLFLVTSDYKNMYMDMQAMLDDPSISPQDKLHLIATESVKIVQDNTRINYPKWNIYSPEAQANVYALTYIRHMNRMTYCTGPSAWTKQSHKQCLKTMMAKWKTNLKKHSRGSTTKYIELASFHSECYGFNYWSNISCHPDCSFHDL